ncbi:MULTISPECIES: hypothetical protein [Lysinibacillus]|uniref:hypothetical protein n=1 Tax=Lysinibacillus TaxID=400634 RepID=UPI00257B4528|nr:MULTISPECIES: hypothetical protein [Lysinibacillus]
MKKNRKFLPLIPLMSLLVLFPNNNSSLAAENQSNLEPFEQRAFENPNEYETYLNDQYHLDEIIESASKNTTTTVDFYSKVGTDYFGNNIYQETILNITLDDEGNLTDLTATRDQNSINFGDAPRFTAYATPKNPDVPYKLNGGSRENDFVTPHAYERHSYDSSRTSSSSRTMYAKDVNVKDLYNMTKIGPDNYWDNKKDGKIYATTYALRFSSNISVKPTITKDHRVIINRQDPDSSTQFPFYQ